MKFSKAYSDNVLRDNFNDTRLLFFHYLMDIQYSHLLMLRQAKLLTAPDAARLAGGLDRISEEVIDKVEYDGTFEDLFYYLERLLEEFCGADLAGRLHTARSRNDIAVTLYRLRWRRSALELLEALSVLRGVLLDIAEKHRSALIPIYTHTQPAQPSTLSHYFLGVVEHLERDHSRLAGAYRAMNRCPLGSCAVTGTGFQIDRDLTSRLLGFDGPTANTHASIVGIDYLLEAAAAEMVSLTTLGRVVQDLLLWCMSEFQFLRLADGFVQCSSIMPQKRNPVALEHCRSLASRAAGEGLAVFYAVHNTPYGDVVDLEDDLQPLVEQMFRNAIRTIRLLSAALSSATFDLERLQRSACANWITVTELADTLARQEGLSFRAAYTVAARLVDQKGQEKSGSLSRILARVSKEVLGRTIQYSEQDLERILSPEHFVAVRTTSGGPALPRIEEALLRSRGMAAEDDKWIRARKKQLEEYRVRLRKRADRLKDGS